MQKEREIMSNPKSTRVREPAAAEKAQVAENFVPLYTKGVELFAELQKKSLDVATQQSAEWIGAWKKAASRFMPAAPGWPLFELAGEAFEAYVETQKGAIDLAVEQSQTVAGIAKDSIESFSKTADGVTALFQKSVEYSVAAQKKALDLAAKQNKAVYETARRQYGIPPTPAAESIQRSFDALVETQKAVLDFASKPLKSAAAA
jgi:hypothetical protein